MELGGLHQCTFHHPLSANPIIADLFNRGPFPTGGDGTTIWATGTGYDDLGAPLVRQPPAGAQPGVTPQPVPSNVIGPPYRMIVDLGDLRSSLSLLAPGQSGHPASPHYDDQVNAWYQAGYHPMLYDLQDVQQHSRHKLNLLP